MFKDNILWVKLPTNNFTTCVHFIFQQELLLTAIKKEPIVLVCAHHGVVAASVNATLPAARIAGHAAGNANSAASDL